MGYTGKLKKGDRILIENALFEGTVIDARHWGDKDGWYIELNADGYGYMYYKQRYDEGIVRKL